MTGPLLLDLTHTSHTQARTGIQRVTRSLHAALGGSAVAVCHDPYARAWRPLERWERSNLAATGGPGGKRGAQWPLAARLRGRLRRGSVHASLLPSQASGLVVPEVFSPATAAALPALFAAIRGPRVAIFHDAIALKLPELTPAGTVARFPAYLCELLRFDGIAAVSADSRDSLLDYWRWLGVGETPPVVALPLGVDVPRPTVPNPSPADDSLPVILCVGTLEGRKNHLALLDACEQLWADGAGFTLRLVGPVQSQTGRAALARVRALQAAGRPLRFDGPVDDATLNTAYHKCAFTVYPSLAEGFGLPVIESLARGRPCVCSGHGALGESARGGGAVPLDSVDAATLAAAMARLLASPGELAGLAAAAHARSFRTWSTYAQELTVWLQALPRRG